MHGYLPADETETPRSVVWTDGELTGDPAAIRLLELESQLNESVPIGNVGEEGTIDHFSSPQAFAELVRRVFGPSVFFTGDPMTGSGKAGDVN